MTSSINATSTGSARNVSRSFIYLRLLKNFILKILNVVPDYRPRCQQKSTRKFGIESSMKYRPTVLRINYTNMQKCLDTMSDFHVYQRSCFQRAGSGK